MENTNDTNPNQQQFEELKARFRFTGVGGVSLPERYQGADVAEVNTSFEDKKEMMNLKGGVATMNVKKQNLPNSRKRNSSNPSLGFKVFSIGDNKGKDIKGKK